MARYRGPVCKLCRADGVKLMLKGKKCLSAKCPLNKRNYAPGMHGQRRQGKKSGYALQLREKQKAKRIYGVLERQFRRYYEKADTMRGVSGENLLQLLECRLDNVVYRLGFANSRAQARQLVRHNHILVNGKRVNIPSFQCRIGNIVQVNEASRELIGVQEAMQLRKTTGSSPWIERNDPEYSGKMVRMPRVEEIQIPVSERQIVELYSK